MATHSRGLLGRRLAWPMVLGGIAVACGSSSDLNVTQTGSGGSGVAPPGRGGTSLAAGGAITVAGTRAVGGAASLVGGFGPMETGGAATATGGGPADGGIPWDALPTEGGPVVDCALCARDHCSQEVDACVAATACLGGIVCSLLSCQSSQFDCLLACFGGDITALTAGINVATCMASQCGPDCARAFGF